LTSGKTRFVEKGNLGGKEGKFSRGISFTASWGVAEEIGSTKKKAEKVF